MQRESRRLTFVGPIDSFTGYGLHSLQIIRDLSRLFGAHIAIRPTAVSSMFGTNVPTDIRSLIVNCVQPEPWELLLHPPNFMPTPGKRTVYFTMWESTKLPPIGVECLNRAEAVVVPTEWQASCFSANGVERPIFVVPLGINTDVFNWVGPNDLYYSHEGSSEKSEVVFGTAGRLAHGGVRKGVNEVIEDFRAAFPINRRGVKLKVKIHPDCPVPDCPDRRVEILRAHIGETEFRDWLASLTCFVSEARGEGWGLIQHQSMAVGRPVMAMRFAGLSAFMTEKNSFCIPYRFEPARSNYSGCGSWAVPLPGVFSRAMRFVADNPDEARLKGALAYQDVAGLSWEESNRKLGFVLKTLGVL